MILTEKVTHMSHINVLKKTKKSFKKKHVKGIKIFLKKKKNKKRKNAREICRNDTKEDK